MFTSAITGDIPKSEIEKTVMPFSIPKQAPKGFDQNKLAKMAQNAMTAIVVVQIVVALCVKSAIKRMW